MLRSGSRLGKGFGATSRDSIVTQELVYRRRKTFDLRAGMRSMPAPVQSLRGWFWSKTG
jgi:hypothetical protein